MNQKSTFTKYLKFTDQFVFDFKQMSDLNFLHHPNNTDLGSWDRIVKLNSSECWCQLCNAIIIDHATVGNHITGKIHDSARRECGYDNIIFVMDNNYHCKCCDRAISFRENVYAHVEMAEHKTELLLSRINKNIKDLRKTDVPKSPNTAKPDQNLSHEYIVHRNDTEYYCAICDSVVTEPENVTEHLMNEQHRYNKTKFSTQNIKFINKNFYCDSCRCMVRGIKNLEFHLGGNRHAHSLLSNDESNERKIKEHENSHEYIVHRNDTEYYCAICDLVVNGRENVTEHLMKKYHRYNKTKFSNQNIKFINNDFYCDSCKCKVSGIENLKLHLGGSRHASSCLSNGESNKREMKEQEILIDKKISATVKISKKSETAPVIDSNSLLKDFILKLNATDLQCKICNVTFINETVSEHVQSKEHAFSLLKYGCDTHISLKDDKTFYCKSCNRTIPDRLGIFVHIKGKNHLSSLSESDLLASQQKNHTSSCNFPCIYIVAMSDTIFCCKICDVILDSKDAVDDHLKNKSVHGIALERYGCKYIHPKGSTLYSCKCCKCDIPNIANVYLHLRGIKHKTLLSQILDTSEKPKILMNNGALVKREAPKAHEISLKSPDISLHVETKEERESLTNGNIAHNAKTCNELSSTSQQSKSEEIRESLTNKNNEKTFKELPSPSKPSDPEEKKANRNITHYAEAYKELPSTSEKSKPNEERESLTNGNITHNEKVFNELPSTSKPSEPEEKKESLANRNIIHYAEAYNEIRSTLQNGEAIGNMLQVLHKLQLNKNCIDNHNDRSDLCNVPRDSLVGTNELQEHLESHLDKKSKRIDGHENNIETNSFETVKIEGNDTRLSANSLLKKSPMERIDSRDNINISIKSDAQSSTYSDNNSIYSPSKFNGTSDKKEISFAKIEMNRIARIMAGFNAKDISQISASLADNVEKVSAEQLKPEGATAARSKFNSASDEREILSFFRTNNRAKIRQYSNEAIRNKLKELDVIVNFERGDINDMRDKLKDIRLGVKLTLVLADGKILCLICQKKFDDTPVNYIEHTRTLEHAQCLEAIEENHAVAHLVNNPNRLSKPDLAHQCMETYESTTVCHICRCKMPNVHDLVLNHIESEIHREKYDNMRMEVNEARFAMIKPEFMCNWYDIHNYWCVPCSVNFDTELHFVRHLRSAGHVNVTGISASKERVMMYDFCHQCALLWYGFRSTYATHRNMPTHKWNLRVHCESRAISETAKHLLRSPDVFINDIVEFCDTVAVDTREKEKSVLWDIETTFAMKLPYCKAHKFGSRLSEFASADNNIDVLLNCDRKLKDGLRYLLRMYLGMGQLLFKTSYRY